MSDSKELLKNVDAILNEEGNSMDEKVTDPMEIIEKYLLPGMANSKNTLGELYKYQIPKKIGVIGKVKYLILSRLRNIVFNVVERESMKQQKFNELVYKTLEKLVEERKNKKTSS